MSSTIRKGIGLIGILHPCQEAGFDDLAPDNRLLVRCCSIPDMGVGLVAVKDISRGTRILAERPFLRLRMPSPEDPTKDELLEFSKRLSRMTERDMKIVDFLYASPSVEINIASTEAWDLLREWYQSGGITNDKGQVVQGIEMEAAIKSTKLRWIKYNTNAVWLDNKGLNNEAGVFPMYTCMNHACVPNVVHTFNETIQRMTIHAMRDIKAGEQLFTDYGPGIYTSRKDRKTEHDFWGFDCYCVACTSPEWQERLEVSRILRKKLTEYGMDAPGSMPFELIPEALKLTRELRGLYARMGLSVEVCRQYRNASRLALATGDLAGAIESARKELKIQELDYGTDTEFLRTDMQGAQFWLEHLQAIAEDETDIDDPIEAVRHVMSNFTIN